MTTRKPVRRAAGGVLTALAAVAVAAPLLGRGAPGQRASAQTMEPLPAPLPTVHTPSAAALRLMPGQPGWREASARRAADGAFYFDATLNGASIRMVFDTGASVVSLRAEDAARAGINVGALGYTIPTSTANGSTTVAPVMLDSLQVGGVTRRNVRAVVSRPGQLDVSLLGQSFLSKLSGYRFEKGELVLQGE